MKSEVDEYIERIDVILKSHRKIIAEAGSDSGRDTSAPVHTPAVVPQHQQRDQFRKLSLLKPKYLEKEANLLEVIHWIKQAKNYINVGYRDAPPKKEVYNTFYHYYTIPGRNPLKNMTLTISH